MKLFVVIFAFVVFPVRAQSPADQTAADYLAATVAFLHADYPQTVTIDNVPYQVWLRPISKDTLFPQIRTVIGTGFFVGDSVNSFLALVTASHVASQMTINSLVTLSTADDRPISFPFSKFVKGKPLSWSVSKEADVAILELAPQKERIISKVSG